MIMLGYIILSVCLFFYIVYLEIQYGKTLQKCKTLQEEKNKLDYQISEYDIEVNKLKERIKEKNKKLNSYRQKVFRKNKRIKSLLSKKK